ncbi:MAG TPA: PEGA domain-containing protein [Pyrinomonadaceae bacterium]|nr:PEGA domain-containing protein [Pyrinomonadaceae bacterium]
MKRLIPLPLSICLLLSVLSTGGSAQKKSAAQKQAEPPAPAAPRPALAFGLSEDTPVKLKLNRTMSSKDAKPDERVDFEVIEDVKIGDVVVIQHGATAIATVTEAHPKRRMGRSGKLNINIDSVQLVSGEKVSLRAVKGGNGGNHTGAMTGAMIATGIVFFPAAPLFLFMHGKDITIPKGTEITAYVAADTPLEPAKFVTNQAPDKTDSISTVSVAAATASGESSAVVVKATPDGAEITINGKYMGSTPSTLQLLPGEYVISIEKSGFKPWQRTITVSGGGSITVDAALDKIP